MGDLQGKKIVLGITGSIAAYKSCVLLRGFIKEGAEVQVVITPAGKEFITPLTLSTLSGKPVVSEFFSRRDGSWNSHVELGLWADAMVIAPATASTISKMACGIADNMLITTYLSMRAPVFVAPAMDVDMYAHQTTQRNLNLLRSYGNHIIEPTCGELASHLEGKGRMEEPENIIAAVSQYFAKGSLKGQKILITAGPTYERIDPVRFIGNYSSGKMGLALADVCAERGADVTLVCGPVSFQCKQPSIQRINVETAAEMLSEVSVRFAESTVTILCAAVADFTPAETSAQKIKRSGEELLLRLKPTQDIAQTLGQMKRKGQILAGFALETENELAHAKEKMERKNFDFIVLNSLNDKGAGFRCDTNKISILSRTKTINFPLKTKKEVATDIINHLLTLL